MNGKIEKKIYVPILLDKGVEVGIGNQNAPGGCMFFETESMAEKFLQKIKKENSVISDCKTTILEFTRKYED